LATVDEYWLSDTTVVRRLLGRPFSNAGANYLWRSINTPAQSLKDFSPPNPSDRQKLSDYKPASAAIIAG